MAVSAEFRFGHIEHEALLGCQGSHRVRGELGRRVGGGCPYTEVPLHRGARAAEEETASMEGWQNTLAFVLIEQQHPWSPRAL